VTPRARWRFLRTIGLIVVILGGGVAGAGVLYMTRTEPPRREADVPPPLVTSIVVQPEDVREHFVGYGTALADRSAKLAAEVAATVVERVGGIRPGSTVTKGQPLIRLDDREYQFAFERAEALADAERASLGELAVEREKTSPLLGTAEEELRVAESERNRVARLFEQNQAAKKEYDFADLAYQQARRTVQGYQRELAKLGPREARLEASIHSYSAAAALAKLNVERCVVRAPFTGSVQSILVDAGDRASPGVVVLAIVDSEHIDIPLHLPAAAYDSVQPGSACSLMSESRTDVSWQGTIARLAPIVDEQSRTFAAYVTVDNTAQRRPLIPGTFVRAVVEGRMFQQRLLVPRGAIRDGRVFVVAGKVAKPRDVQTQQTLVDRAIISDGLKAGDRVIISPLDIMVDGLTVRIDTPASGFGERDPTSGVSPTTQSGAANTP